MDLDKDAFSSGQIGSKIWLIAELEEIIKKEKITHPLKIAIIGGWYGLTNFIIQCRQTLNIEYVRSIDIDHQACTNADLLNELWVWQDWKFKALCRDANHTEYFEYDIIINSSVEHIPNLNWWENIPEGKIVVLQSNNMTHEDHVFNHLTLNDFSNDFSCNKVLFLGEKIFDYKDWKFTRFMKIGIK